MCTCMIDIFFCICYVLRCLAKVARIYIVALKLTKIYVKNTFILFFFFKNQLDEWRWRVLTSTATTHTAYTVRYLRTVCVNHRIVVCAKDISISHSLRSIWNMFVACAFVCVCIVVGWNYHKSVPIQIIQYLHFDYIGLIGFVFKYSHRGDGKWCIKANHQTYTNSKPQTHTSP